MTYETLKEKYKETVDEILQNIEAGMTEQDSCILAGIPKATHYDWKANIPEYADDCRRAKINYKKTLITAVNVNSIRSGKIALEVLRRRFPKEWNVSRKIEMDVKEKLDDSKISEIDESLKQQIGSAVQGVVADPEPDSDTDN